MCCHAYHETEFRSMALKQPYGSGLAAGRLRESRAVRPGSRARGGRVDGQAGEVGMEGFL